MAVNTADRVHAALMGSLMGSVAAYWVGYYTTDAVRTADDPAYEQFQRSFALAETTWVATGLAASERLWQGKSTAVPLGIATGSAAVFLGLVDVLWNIQHGKCAERTPEMGLETAINVICLTAGPATMVRLWRARDRLEG